MQEELRRLRAEEVLVAQAASLANGAALAEGPAGGPFGPGERDMGEQNRPCVPCRVFWICAWERVPDVAVSVHAQRPTTVNGRREETGRTRARMCFEARRLRVDMFLVRRS